jgi:hypothetical protein
MEYYAAMKGKGIMIYDPTWLDPEHLMLGEISQM